MNFYTALSTYYDEIFAVSQSDMDFINKFLPPKGRILDVGCGTGNKTVLLHSLSGASGANSPSGPSNASSPSGANSIVAIDLDAGMIEYARTHHARPHIHYQQLDMRHIATQFGSKSAAAIPFDAVLCLGNTLVHLPKNELAPFFHAVKDVLRSGGSCVIQILNYDRIIDKSISLLPIIETEHTIFTRHYHVRDGSMHFCTSITLRATGESVNNDIILYPLRTGALEQLLSTAGFRKIHWYGSFAGAPLSEDSFAAIVHCVA